MKRPTMPPALHDYADSLPEKEDLAYMRKIMMDRLDNVGVVDHKGRYLHWDKLQYVPLPESVETTIEHWHRVKWARLGRQKKTVFKDEHRLPFVYVETDRFSELKDRILTHATGTLSAPEQVNDPSTKETYLISSLIEESINSSQMEGASTTRRVAKDMLRSGREPKDHSERMISNNYLVMQFIRELLEGGDIPLTPEIVLAIHDKVTDGTLSGEDAGKGGQYREDADHIIVGDPNTDNVLHVPPSAALLKDRMQHLCDFVNSKTDPPGSYLPPVIRAIITHFLIGYDHPFVEGNGRTARALFYWVMIKHNYWLMEYVSISSVIKRNQQDYLRAYLRTETDDNDLTYFILQQLEVINEAIDVFHAHVARRVEQDQQIRQMFKSSALKKSLNPRQISLIRNALSNPGNSYTIKSHSNSHACSKEVARRDLRDLADNLELLEKYKKDAKALVFVAPHDLAERINRAEPR